MHIIYTDEGNFEAYDITATGAAQRGRARDEFERKTINAEADESRSEWDERAEMS